MLLLAVVGRNVMGGVEAKRPFDDRGIEQIQPCVPTGTYATRRPGL